MSKRVWQTLLGLSAAVVITMVLPPAVCGQAALRRADGQLQLDIVDAETGLPLAVRMELRNSRRQAVTPPGAARPPRGDYFYVEGEVPLPLRAGAYTFQIDAGPEYRPQTGHFEISPHADDRKRVEMRRAVDLAAEGWWGGDLDVPRPPADTPLAMRAEGLSVLPGQAWQNIDGTWSEPRSPRAPTGRQRRGAASGELPLVPAAAARRPLAHGLWAGLDQRRGSALLLFGEPATADLRSAAREATTSLGVARSAGAAGARVVARTPLAWDLPTWLAIERAVGGLDAVNLIHYQSLDSSGAVSHRAGRPRDPALFPGRQGNSRWSEAIYYHLLDCGLRIPPAAGSGSGASDSPIGESRVYVHCGQDFSYERWWEGLAAGRVFITNGPLLRPSVEGQPPGHVFAISEGDVLSLEIGLELATRSPIEYLEIVKNGSVEIAVRLADWTSSRGRLPPLAFDESGWFLVRAITSDTERHQFASTGPYFVQKEGEPRISRRSVEFFLDWIDQAAGRLAELEDISEPERAQMLAEQAAAREFFDALRARANAD